MSAAEMGCSECRVCKATHQAAFSVGANYIKASDCLGAANEKMKLKIARREAKESIFWLKLILTYDKLKTHEQRMILINEAEQIKKILSAIISKIS